MSQTVFPDPLKYPLPLRQFTVSEYHRIGEAGILKVHTLFWRKLSGFQFQ